MEVLLELLIIEIIFLQSKFTQSAQLNVVTVLKVEFYLISLERTGGPEEEGVRMFKNDLRESVLKKDSNRLGDFEDNEFYLVSTRIEHPAKS